MITSTFLHSKARCASCNETGDCQEDGSFTVRLLGREIMRNPTLALVSTTTLTVGD